MTQLLTVRFRRVQVYGSMCRGATPALGVEDIAERNKELWDGFDYLEHTK